jgi:hypothetical protein
MEAKAKNGVLQLETGPSLSPAMAIGSALEDHKAEEEARNAAEAARRAEDALRKEQERLRREREEEYRHLKSPGMA